MSLKNVDHYFDYMGNPTLTSKQLFEQGERRVEQKKQVLDDMQNEYELLQQQLFNLYREHVYYNWCFSKSSIEGARSWLRMQKEKVDADGNKLDGRKNYPEKDYYKYLTDDIQDNLGIKNIQITRIIDYNFGEADEIEFVYEGHEWRLNVPNVKHLEMKAFLREGNSCFKLQLYHKDSDVCWSLIGSTFEESELANIMAKGVSKWCWCSEF